MRHAFASLLIHEGRLSVVDIAAQLGHNPTVCLDTYAHVMAEQRGAEPISAEQQILHARSRHGSLRRQQLEGQVAPPGIVPTLGSNAVGAPRPSRLSIWSVEPDAYGVDLTFQGATGYADAERVQRELQAAGLMTTFREEFEGGWTVRFGPLPRERLRSLLDGFTS